MRDLVLYASCVTRDPLAIVEHDFNILYFHARTNLPSLSSKIPVKSIEVDHVRSDHNFHKRCYNNDLAKNFNQDFKDKIVIFDFIDDRFPTALIDKTMFTYNSLFFNENPHVEKDNFKVVMHHNPLNWDFVTERVHKVAENFSDFLKNNHIILHKAFFDPNYTGKTRTKESIKEMNAYYEFLYSKIEKIWGVDYSIDIRGHIDSPADHRWGHSPFHHSDNYAKYFVEELKLIAEDIQRKKYASK